MTICHPSRNTCAECWKYKNKLGIILHQENAELQRQVCTEIDEDELDKLIVETENVEGDNNINTNTSNNKLKVLTLRI